MGTPHSLRHSARSTDVPIPEELYPATAAAPLVVRVGDFLRWVGPHRALTRVRDASEALPRGYVIVSLDRHACEDDPGGLLGGLDSHAELLAVTLDARFLSITVDRRERDSTGRERQHGYVIPGPAYPALPRDAPRLWCALVERLPLLWGRRDPCTFSCPAQRLAWLILNLLERQKGEPMSMAALSEALESVPGARSALRVGCELLNALAAVELVADDTAAPSVRLTELGRHAGELLARPGPGGPLIARGTDRPARGASSGSAPR